MGLPPAQATSAPSGRDLYVSCTFPFSRGYPKRCLVYALLSGAITWLTVLSCQIELSDSAAEMLLK
jgi:hypothetical protein